MRLVLSILAVLIGAAGLAVSPAAPSAHAQAVVSGDTLAFERVGDVPLDAHDLAFDSEGALWAINSDVWRLPPGGTVWEEIALLPATSYILPLGQDTLLAGGTSVDRSLNGGKTWEEVYDEGQALFEASSSGAIVTGIAIGSGVAYSHDRGATWQPGALDAGTWVPVAKTFAELPEGHVHAGRIVAGCWAGLSYSDDGGKSWQPSGLWENGGRYFVPSVTVGANGWMDAAFSEVGVAGTQIAVSNDGGETYTVAYGFGVSVGTEDRIMALPGGDNPEVGVLVLVEYDGSVWRSDDGAASWQQVGQVPWVYPFPSSRLRDATLGPHGRLYVAGGAIGPDMEWVYRTVGPVVTAAEPDAPPEEMRVRLGVRPNPFRGSAEVTFEVGAAAQVRVVLYDVLGREVAVLADGAYAAGRHPLPLDASALAPGVYALHLTAGGEALTRQFTVVR